MDYRFVDILNADQLEVGDLIGLGIVGIVKIISIAPTKDGFLLVIEMSLMKKKMFKFLMMKSLNYLFGAKNPHVAPEMSVLIDLIL